MPQSAEILRGRESLLATADLGRVDHVELRDAARTWWRSYERQQKGPARSLGGESLAWAQGVWSGCGYIQAWQLQPAGRRASHFAAVVLAESSAPDSFARSMQQRGR